MQLFKKGQAEPTGTAPVGTAKESSTKLWLSNNKRSIAAVALIVLAALFMRTIFAYAVSANSGFALSGGTTATEHLRNIVAIITSGHIFGPDSWLFHPFGSDNIHPPLIDMILAGFAWIVMSITHMSAEQAASFTLGASSAIMGALACIPMYYLGKEVFDGKKRAGFLAALFLAFCPIVVTNTVFSNGTTIAFTLFFTICLLYFAVKGIKAIDNDHTLDLDFRGMLTVNNEAMKYALISGIFFAVIAYSWNGFRSLAIFIIFMMVVMMVVNRLMGKDVRALVTFFTIILGIGVIASAPFYVAAGLWDLVFSGIAYVTIIALVFCIAFAFLQSKPWIYTIPGFIIAAIVLFVALNFGLHDVFNVIVSGNSIYAKDIQGLISTNTLSFSAVATYFGFFTMWCGAICVIYMVFKFNKNSKSNLFVVTLFALLFGILFAVRSAALAVVFAPFYALGFAAVINWMFETISFSDYFKSFKGCDIKTIWKKIFNPKPFIAIFCVLLLVAAPNMLTAVDASISNNEKSDWNEGASEIFNKAMFGSVGYTVYTDNEYKINYTLKQFGENGDDNGTMLTWFEYSADVVTYGHFKSVTDTRGNNAVAMAQILLGDETRGEATTAMIIYSMYTLGYEKGINEIINHLEGKPEIYTQEIRQGVEKRLNDVFNNPSAYKEYILKDQSTYGQLSTDISNENAVYIFLKKYLTQGTGAGQEIGNVQDADKNFPGISTWELSHLYSKISKKANTHIDKIMVTIGMLPIQYGDGSVFSEIAAIAGYSINGTYGNAPQFYSVNSSTGAYSYTTAMYNTLLYKTIGGKTSAESSASMDASKFEAVYGISNFSADYDHFYVKYNSNKDATASSDGWEMMTYDKANELKAEKGGVINYFGYPVIIDVVTYGSSDGTNDYANGHVKQGEGTSATPVTNARVEAWAENGGNKLAMAYTDKNGYYEIPVKEKCVIRIYAGAASTDTSGGTLVKSENGVEETTKIDCNITNVNFSGYVDFQDQDLEKKFVEKLPNNVVITLTGTNYKKTYTTTGVVDLSAHRINFSFTENLVIDTYSIKVATADGTSLGTGSYLLTMGVNEGYRIAGTICDTTITVTGTDSVPLEGKYVRLVADGDNSLVYELGDTDYAGKTHVKPYMAPGKYTVEVYSDGTYAKESLLHSSSITVTSSGSTNTVTMSTMLKVTIDFKKNIGNLMVTNGIENYVARWNGTNYTVYVPKPGYIDNLDESQVAAQYLVYQYYQDTALTAEKERIVHATFVPKDNLTVTNVSDDPATLVSGKLTYKSSDSEAKAASGTVYFYINGVTIAAVAEKAEGSDDYTYSIYLPKSSGTTEYKYYATNGSSMVKFGSISVNGEPNIEMGEGYKVSGKFYWGSSNYFSHAKLTVKGLADLSDFTIITDTNGAYSLVVPKDSKFTIETPSLEKTQYYFDAKYNEEKKVLEKTYQTKHEFSSDSKTYSFIAYTNKVKAADAPLEENRHNYIVQNDTDYTLYIDGTKVEAGKTKTYDYSLSHPYITVKINYELIDGHYVYCENIKIIITPVEPENPRTECTVYHIAKGDQSIAKAVADKDNWYTEVKVTYTEVKPTVTITNMRSSEILDGEKPFANLTIKSGTDSTEGKYVQKFIRYNKEDKELEKDGFLTSPYLVKVTSTIDNEDWIYYTTLIGNETTVTIIGNKSTATENPGVLQKAVVYSGTVGAEYSGTMKITDKTNAKWFYFTTTVTSGSYSISLPNTAKYNIKIDVSTTSDGYKYNYWLNNGNGEELTVTIPESASVNPKITHNFAVEFHNQKLSNGGQAVLGLNITEMTEISGTHKYKVLFTATISDLEEDEFGTYKLSGGSDWDVIRFYSDPGRTHEISTVTITSREQVENVYCEGVISVNYKYDGDKVTDTATATWGSVNLSVSLTTIAGKTFLKEYFGSGGGQLQNWTVTDLPIKVGFGSNVYAENKRVFSVKFVNPNNFPVEFKINLSGTGLDNCQCSVTSGKDIKVYTEGTTMYISIAGSSTSEINVQTIPMNGKSTTIDIQTLHVDFNVNKDRITWHVSFERLDQKDTDITIGADGVYVENTIKKDQSIDIKDHSSSGRGVFNSLGSAPAYLMVLAGLTLLGIIAMIWLGYRRGVFARKK